MEHPIWSPDEQIMSPGRLAPESDQLDQSRGGQTDLWTGQTGLNMPIRVRSCTSDIGYVRICKSFDS